MIKKINLNKRNSFGTLDWLAQWNKPSGAKLIEEKINELVDAVNELQEQYDNICVWVGEQKLKTPADPYAEQQKWIGKLCKFWDDNSKITKHLGILTRIDEMAIVPYEAENGFWYCACEPVKPDDDIIYKGGDNE